MSATKIDGKLLAAKLREEVKVDAEKFEREYGRKIGLAVILAGENPASKIYVRNKIAACEETGVKSMEYYFPDSVTTEELVELVETLNADENVDGLLVQLPLPAGVNEKAVLGAVTPGKRRRRLSRRKRRQSYARQSVSCGMHSVRGNGTYKEHGYDYCGETRGSSGAQQYRRQACRAYASQ